MKTQRTTSLLSTALMLLASFTARCGTAETRVFTNEAGGFEIALPSDWKEIPREVVEEVSSRLSARMTVLQKQPYKYAYQPAGSDHWFTYPYLLVQVNEQGPVTEKDFTNALQNKDAMESAVKQKKDQAGNLLKNADASISGYDAQRHMLRFAIHDQLPDGGEITGISAAFLTSRGALNFHFYARKEDFDAWKGAFESAIDSVKLSGDLAYKPPPDRRGFGNEVLLYALVGGCVGAAVSLFKRLSIGKKPNLPRRTNEPPPLP